MENINHILYNINKLIDAKNLNRSKISSEMKLNRTTLYNYLDGKTPMPVEFLLNISNYLGVQPSYLLGETIKNNSIDIDSFFNEIKEIVTERINNKNK